MVNDEIKHTLPSYLEAAGLVSDFANQPLQGAEEVLFPSDLL